MAKKHGHYCKVCEEYKSNESFSGKGHSAHICKKCAVLSPAERSREMTLARLMNLPYRLSAEQKAWLKGLQKEKCPEIAEAAQMVYAEHFPYAERNERKQQLHISEMTFVVQDELWDEYGDSFDAQIMFILDRKTRLISCTQAGASNTIACGNGPSAGTRKRAANGLPGNTGTISTLASGHSLFPMKTRARRANRSIANLNMQPIRKSSDLRKSWRKQIRLMNIGRTISRNERAKSCSTVPRDGKSC